MCELTLIHSGIKRVNQILLLQQLLANTSVSNKDGFGFTGTDKIYKSSLNASAALDLGHAILDNIKDDRPIIAHVRLATAVKAVKTITDDTAHPFETSKLILAHNGVLELKDTKRHDEKHKDIPVDSLIFLRELDEAYTGNNFVDAFQQTLDLFYGTYAFLIYSKLENRYFVIRGATKKLHYAKIDVCNGKNQLFPGIIINTEKADLSNGILNTDPIIQIIGNSDLLSSKIEEVPEKTINELNTVDNVLVELGKTKEEAKPYYNSNFCSKNQTRTSGEITVTGVNHPFSEELFEFLIEAGLNLLEWDSILYFLTGKPLISCTIPMQKEVIDKIKDKILSYSTKEKQEIWKAIKRRFANIATDVYMNYDELKFPYFMNSVSALKKVYKKATGKNYDQKAV